MSVEVEAAVGAAGGSVPPRASTPLPVPRRLVAAVRLNEVERADHLALARLWGCSLSDAVRRAIHDCLRAERAVAAVRDAVLNDGAGGEAEGLVFG